MGVPIPVIEKKSLALGVLERGYSIIGTSGRIDEVAEKFEAELDLIVGSRRDRDDAPPHRPRDPDDARRRVNALEQVMIPELYRQNEVHQDHD